MSDEQAVHLEMNDIRAFIEGKVALIEAGEGDIRLFAGALLVAAVQLHTEIEGISGLRKALMRCAEQELLSSGAGIRC